MFRLASLTGQLARMSLTPQVPTTIQCRFPSFFVRASAEQIWKGVTSVSNAGRKRGRAAGSSKKTSKDLNRGQIIGEGPINMIWPGLNAPMVRGKEVVARKQLRPDPEREQRILALRNQSSGLKRQKLTPLERGWSGTKIGGRSIGPPDPVGEEKFEGFDSCVVKLSLVAVMRSTTGRTRQQKSIVLVGNGNGLLGFARGVASNPRAALKQAKNRAVRNLCYYERFEDHTVLHDFYTQWGSCKLIVKKKQRGHGLVCQRVVKEMCKIMGIKDLYVKADGRRMNTLSVIRAFLNGLQNQRSFQSIAEEKRLHVVEFRPEYDYFPKVVASPKKAPVRTEEEILPREELDFDMIINDGKIVTMPKKKEPFYWKLPGYQKYLKKIDPWKNSRMTRLRLLKRYGGLQSFLTIRKREQEQKMEEISGSN